MALQPNLSIPSLQISTANNAASDLTTPVCISCCGHHWSHRFGGSALPSNCSLVLSYPWGARNSRTKGGGSVWQGKSGARASLLPPAVRRNGRVVHPTLILSTEEKRPSSVKRKPAISPIHQRIMHFGECPVAAFAGGQSLPRPPRPRPP